MLDEISSRIPLTVHKSNIEDDDALLALYVFEIPVVTAAGVEIARAPIRREVLERALRQLAQDADRT